MIYMVSVIKGHIKQALSQRDLDFFELQTELITRNCNVLGEYEIFDSETNALFWDGISYQFRRCIFELIESEEIEIKPCSINRYKNHECDFSETRYLKHGEEYQGQRFQEETFVPCVLRLSENSLKSLLEE